MTVGKVKVSKAPDMSRDNSAKHDVTSTSLDPSFSGRTSYLKSSSFVVNHSP